MFLKRRLTTVIEPGPKAYAPRDWLTTSAPISLVEGFYVLLTYSDVIILAQFRPPQEVAVYYAAAKIMALVAFIYFAVAQTVAHKFSEYHVTGNRKRLADFLAQTIRMTFWPSLALIAVLLLLGDLLLRMFGKDFVAGYPLMFVIAVGLLARAAVGPAERLLNMLGERRSCAHAYAGAFLLNVALCFVLIPHFGGIGAAIASATALVFEFGVAVPDRENSFGPALPDFRPPERLLRRGHDGQDLDSLGDCQRAPRRGRRPLCRQRARGRVANAVRARTDRRRMA